MEKSILSVIPYPLLADVSKKRQLSSSPNPLPI